MILGITKLKCYIEINDKTNNILKLIAKKC